jgi:hypothetical protein
MGVTRKLVMRDGSIGIDEQELYLLRRSGMEVAPRTSRGMASAIRHMGLVACSREHALTHAF